MTTRRHALALLAAAPFIPNCAPAQTPDAAASWRHPDAAAADPRRYALAHAILAPNPHNTQAWQVAFDGDDGMTLYCDLERRLPFTDPPNRQITLGCGAFLELYRLAAQGRAVEITPFPEGEPDGLLDQRPVAHVKLGAPTGEAPDPLFAHIGARRTNRNVYDARTPESDKLQAIAAAGAGPGLAAEAIADATRLTLCRDLVWQGFEREAQTIGALEETYGWLRFGRADIARHRDGLAVEGPLVGPLRTLGLLGHGELINPNSFANRQADEDWRRKAMSAPAFMALMSEDDRPPTRLRAGMAYARMNLTATAQGLAMHPWSQTLQEYREMTDLYHEMYGFLNAGARKVQMLVRVGYAEAVAPSARRDAGEFIRA